MRTVSTRFATLALCSLATIATPALAANTQQELMKSCNTEAKIKAVAGAARKDFMSHCLKGEPTEAAAPTTPQERMKNCNADPQAKALKGTERKAFMSSCLKK